MPLSVRLPALTPVTSLECNTLSWYTWRVKVYISVSWRATVIMSCVPSSTQVKTWLCRPPWTRPCVFGISPVGTSLGKQLLSYVSKKVLGAWQPRGSRHVYNYIKGEEGRKFEHVDYFYQKVVHGWSTRVVCDTLCVPSLDCWHKGLKKLISCWLQREMIIREKELFFLVAK